MSWTPYQIEIMLHHHCSAARFSRDNAPAYAETVRGLIDMGLLVDSDGSIRSTLLGKAMVKLWCSTPIPEMRFVDPRYPDRRVCWARSSGRCRCRSSGPCGAGYEKWGSDEAKEAFDDIQG